VTSLASSIGGGACRMTLLEALGYGPECWDALAGSSPIPSPFMRWGWHQAWVRSATPEEVQTSFAVVLNGPSGCVRGVLPLAVRPLSFRRGQVTALTWAIGNVGCPDHLDLPAAAGVDFEAVVPVLEELRWDIIILGGVADGAGNLSRLIKAFARRGYAVRRTPLDSCPYIDLPRSWDEYLAGLSRSRRQTIRRRTRKLAREHAMVITDYAPDRLEEGWRRLQSLHQARWSGRGALGDQLDQLLRHFSSDLAARGELWLTSLDLNGQPIAAWYGFACGDTVYFYQSGRDPRWASASVGLVLQGAMIRRAIERGYRRFDFLRGCDAYKLSWTSSARPIYEVILFRPGWRGAWLRGLDLVGQLRARLRARAAFAASER
jgi:CelD/BcsL family acetyltransferase involved in cellulose biosynthesis